MTLLYVIGEPGIGKSTAVAGLLAPYAEWEVSKPIAHRLFTDDRARLVAIALGKSRAGFPGTDTLPMNVMPRACEWIGATSPHDLVIGEGDRLASPKFWTAAERAGHRVGLVALTASPEVASERRARRGSVQQDAWLTGRMTRVRNTIRDHGPEVIDADRAPEEIVADLARLARNLGHDL